MLCLQEESAVSLWVCQRKLCWVIWSAGSICTFQGPS